MAITLGNGEVLKTAASLKTILDYKKVFKKDLLKEIAKLNPDDADAMFITELIYILQFKKDISYEAFIEKYKLIDLVNEKSVLEATDILMRDIIGNEETNKLPSNKQ